MEPRIYGTETLRRVSNRRSSRSTLPQEFHLGELDDDVDELYQSMSVLKTELLEEIKAFRRECEEQNQTNSNELKSVKGILIGLLISITTVSIIFAGNIVLKAFSGGG